MLNTDIYGQRSSHLAWALAGAALLLPLLLMLAQKGSVPLFTLVALVGVSDAVRHRNLALPSRPVLVALAAFLGWGAASALWETTPGLAVAKTCQLLALSVAALICTGGVRAFTQAERGRVKTALVAGMTIAAAFVAFEHLSNVAAGRWLHVLAGSPIGDLKAMYIYKSGATVCSILAPLAIGAAALSGRRGLAVALAVAVLAMTLLTGSLTGMVALAAAGTVAVLGLVARRAALLAVIAAMLTGFAVAPLARILPDTAIISSHVGLPLSALHRTMIWHFVASRAMEKPVLGWGLDASRALPGGNGQEMLTSKDVKLLQQVLPLHPHNMFLQVWVELGAVGAVIAGGMLTALLAGMRGAGRWGGTVALPAMAAALVVSAISFGAWQSWWIATLGMFAAVMLACRPTGEPMP